MATLGGPNISLDGLVFGYDTGYGIADNVTSTRFYPGKPTSNTLETEANWIYLGTNITNPSDYPVSLPAEVNFQKGASQGGISWSDACQNYADSYSAGTKITVSGWHMFHSTDTSLSMSSRDRLGWHYSRDGVSTYGGTIYTATEWNKWYYFSSTFSSTGVTTNLRVEDGGADYYRSSEDAAKTTQYYCNLQIEVGTDVVSPYIKGSRSSTGSLIDLKETTDIDLSNVSFDSTGQPTFDGTDDVISLDNNFDLDTHFNDGGSFSIDVIVKMKESASQNGGIVCNQRYKTETDPAGFGLVISSTNKYGINLTNNTPESYQSLAQIPFNQNEYHHITYTFEKNLGKVVAYSNGSEYTSSTSTSYSWNIPTDSTRTLIGKNTQGGWGNYINMDIVIAKIHNRVLSAEEVKQNYNAYKKRFGI